MKKLYSIDYEQEGKNLLNFINLDMKKKYKNRFLKITVLLG